MTSNKYVVLNCPTLMGNRLCYSKVIKQCADCTDCVIKRVIEKCNEYITVLEIHKHDTKGCGFDNILQLFDIEEINK